MPRRPKPWFKTSHNAWYVKHGGKLIRLADNEKDARREFHLLMAGEQSGPPTSGIRAPVADMLDAWCAARFKDSIAPDTRRVYARYAQSFIDFVPVGTKAADVRPATVRAWLDSHSRWGSATRRLATVAIKGAYRWGLAEGWIESNPIAGVRIPEMPVREPADRADVEAVFGAIPAPALEVLVFILETGCRPGEAVRMTASDIDFKAGTARVVGKTGPRLVLIPSRYLPTLRGIARKRQEGPLFRKSTGEPWRPHLLAGSVRRARQRLGLTGVVVPYHLRGIFATDRIAAGVDNSIVGKMLGHAKPFTLHKHYHNPELDTLRDAVDKPAPAKGKKKPRPKPGA